MTARGFATFGKHDDNTLDEMGEVMLDARYGALMADAHKGYSMPIGGVAAYRDQVNVAGVGVDIACGNCAMRTVINLEDLGEHKAWMRNLGLWIQQNIEFGMKGQVNRSSRAPRDYELFDDPAWELVPQEHRSQLIAKARNQLGTVGGGNHYVDLLVDEAGYLWVGVHFGSRRFGYDVSNAYVSIAQGGAWGEKGDWNQSSLLDLGTPVGDDYWELMQLAGRYAYAGRDWVCREIIRWMESCPVDIVHNNHNFAWQERHYGENLIVVRKGATPAFPGQRGFVGGSMGDDAVILQGVAVPEESEDTATPAYQRRALFSTVHGAGRVRSRTATRGKVKKGKIVRPGLVSLEEARDWVKRRDVFVFGGDIDESPQAYRRLDEVLAHQGITIDILHTLTPRVVVMAPGYSGANPFLTEVA
ncbi:hypothetical protein LCGC14_0859790 [marine sediment metagenome]|uniref:3'-phosphate/5'-hydroxy nucleic acid ligase n=1 Tax=marine sediment metagenome TaxID=412755 RepID=A0A0F9PCN8_9ZZZZ